MNENALSKTSMAKHF